MIPTMALVVCTLYNKGRQHNLACATLALFKKKSAPAQTIIAPDTTTIIHHTFIFHSKGHVHSSKPQYSHGYLSTHHSACV